MLVQLSGEIDQNVALSPQVYQLLRQSIVKVDIKPGQRLSDIELAKSLGISRQPLREAFMRLQADDLLDVRPQRGTFVKRISVASVLDARFVREAIEADIVCLAAESADKLAIKELKNQLSAQRKVHKSSPEQFMKLDDEFHRLLADIAGKPNAWNVIEELKTQMDRVRYLSFNHFHVKKLIVQHASVVNAIDKGNAADAVAVMRLHLRGILDSIHLITTEFPDFFIPEADLSLENSVNHTSRRYSKL